MSIAQPPLLTLWISGELDWVSVACLKSAVKQGHDVDLYSYGDVPNLPRGVHHKDARIVVPEDEIFYYDGVNQPGLLGSPAPFSDAFRYRAQKQARGVWMDSDIYALRQLDLSSPTILAWEKPENIEARAGEFSNLVGNSLMRLPPSSGIVRDLVKLTSRPYKMPPWVARPLQKKVWEKLDGKPFFPGAVSYATFGPVALTYYARKRKILSDIRFSHVFYPVSYTDVQQFGARDSTFRESLPAQTEAIHLWNSAFMRAFADGQPENSFAAKLREESLNA